MRMTRKTTLPDIETPITILNEPVFVSVFLSEKEKKCNKQGKKID